MPDIGTIFRVGETLKRAIQADAVFRQSDQEHVDRIVRSVYRTVMNNRIKFAKMAVEETGLGRWEDKVLKTVVASQFVYEYIKDRKTVGVVSDDVEKGITEIAHPIGTVLGIVSKTDPIASAVFKIIIAMKTRNPIIIASDPKAVKTTEAVCDLCYEAALKEDAPEDCIQCFYDTSTDEFENLIADKRLNLIIAAGDGAVKENNNVKAPVIGSGSGNVPVYIAEDIDPDFVAKQIIDSKVFDQGVMNSSEQAVVINKNITKQFKTAIEKKGGHFVTEKEKKMLIDYVLEKGDKVNKDITGQSPQIIAANSGFKVPETTKLLIVPLKGVGSEYPLSEKVLAPLIAFYEVEDFHEAINVCIDLNYYEGIGHTVCIYSNDHDKIKKFAMEMNAGRVIVNSPSSMGAVGGIYNLLPPSFSLACGAVGKTITMDNVSIKHLINLQRISRRRINQRLRDFDRKMYIDESKNIDEIERLFNKNY
ncbi:MAG: aldehyde dehydrogenase family protein [Victivallales bacterium]|nr:aldehyde dehydrogenase family protein [Victivallales bacterium]MCF7889078.1 aldehyde dehydrogenase family protein [Victivallales bacterium]